MLRPTVLALSALTLLSCGAPPPAPEATESVQRAVTTPQPRFSDHDPFDWQGQVPWAYPVHGIDVSRWQRDIDWRRARASGVSFAFIKATEGVEELDPMFRAHWDGAGRAGVPRGAYHYFYFCAPADKQARWFIRNVPRSATSLPHVLDMEWNPHSPTCRKRPDGATVRAEAKRFLDILEQHYGRRPILYTTVDFARDTGIERLPGTEFWLRSVAGHPRETYPGARWTFWQYTGTGKVTGVDGPVDINVFRGSAADWQVWGQAGAMAQATP
ncbi:Lyzozyme M1 (1,4-beta-N-acetylmuramidase) [Rhodovulum sp. P5]|uniref:glycoside hydrolase family 25 protein n=1 Tax=Rhodovulum sp. P5 TaxID=1564506 RepID=UPI0009C21798|nr:GH25 family lysozyme [Rhodovulum sp. P5]ARE39947.1 Lyzozyme M1 (1,4-beta-N-acetylmuramidase) [Rhodovulum sp. P5]